MRLTIERARKVMDQYGLTLKRRVWANTRGECCPLGLLLIEKDGADRSKYAKAIADRLGDDIFTLDQCIPKCIAEYLNIDEDYAYGLNDGFEDWGISVITTDSEQYQNGRTDGQALATFAGY